MTGAAVAKRVGLVATIVFAIGLVVLVASIAGQTLCSPGPLVGDEAWTRWQQLFSAFNSFLWLGNARAPHACFRVDAFGAFGEALLLFAGLAPVIVAATAIIAVGWVSLSGFVQEAWLRTRGGHLIIAADVDGVADYREKFGRRFVVIAASHDEFRRLQSRFWLSTVRWIPNGRTIRTLARLGASRAAEIVAASTSDTANIEIARQAIRLAVDRVSNPSQRSWPTLVARIESPVLRNLKARELALAAHGQQIDIVALSMVQMQVRRGALAAIPFVFRRPGSPVHVVVCGSGPLLEQLALQIAQQAYFQTGSQPPLLTVIQYNANDFSLAVAERLRSAAAAAEVQFLFGDANDQSGFERSATSALVRAPITAVHCAGPDVAEVQGVCTRWEEFLVTVGPIPFIVGYPMQVGEDSFPQAGATGMIRWSLPPALTAAASMALEIDAEAIAIHESYQEHVAPLADSLPYARQRWAELRAEIQDSNRYAADHLPIKLDLVGCRAEVGADPPGANFSPAEVEYLATVEHLRWMAEKALSGYVYGPVRDDARRVHDKMIPWENLSEVDRDKDRDSVRNIPKLLRAGGKRIVRDFGCYVSVPSRLDEVSFSPLLSALQRRQTRHPDEHVVVWVRLASDILDFAEAVIEHHLSLGVVDHGNAAILLADTDGLDRAARLMEKADRFAPFAGAAEGASIPASLSRGVAILAGDAAAPCAGLRIVPWDTRSTHFDDQLLS